MKKGLIAKGVILISLIVYVIWSYSLIKSYDDSLVFMVNSNCDKAVKLYDDGEFKYFDNASIEAHSDVDINFENISATQITLVGLYDDENEFDIEHGRTFTNKELLGENKVAIVTEQLAYEILDNNCLLKSVQINEEIYTIIGIVDTPTILETNSEYCIYIPLKSRDKYDKVFVNCKCTEDTTLLKTDKTLNVLQSSYSQDKVFIENLDEVFEKMINKTIVMITLSLIVYIILIIKFIKSKSKKYIVQLSASFKKHYFVDWVVNNISMFLKCAGVMVLCALPIIFGLIIIEFPYISPHLIPRNLYETSLYFEQIKKVIMFNNLPQMNIYYTGATKFFTHDALNIVIALYTIIIISLMRDIENYWNA